MPDGVFWQCVSIAIKHRNDNSDIDLDIKRTMIYAESKNDEKMWFIIENNIADETAAFRISDEIYNIIAPK